MCEEVFCGTSDLLRSVQLHVDLLENRNEIGHLGRSKVGDDQISENEETKLFVARELQFEEKCSTVLNNRK